MRRALLVALAALVLAPGAHAGGFQTASGLGGTLPRGWRVFDGKLTPCIDPAEVLTLATFTPGRRQRLPAGGALITVLERDTDSRRMAARPSRFRLNGAPSFMECCVPLHSRGWSLQFSEGGRGFYVYAFATKSRRAQVLSVLDSLRVEPRRALAVRWRESRAVGLPWAGTLVAGVQLPPRGSGFFTWDPLLRGSPDRGWRRWGTGRLVRTVLDVVAAYRTAHPSAPPLGIGDLSRPHGGAFGPKHHSHQNGLDVDVYYPRADRRLRPPDSARQIDHALAQDLVDRFVRAGATRIFVGPDTHLSGPSGVVQVLAGHDNHVHVRIAPRNTRLRLGRSAQRRPIEAIEVGDPSAPRRVLVVGCIHGTECAGTAIVRRLERAHPRGDVWIVPNLNPDGLALGTRLNARGVDLNRNFPSGWSGGGRPGDPEYPGTRPFSEPETRLAAALIARLRPDVTIWYHQPLSLVRAWGRSVHEARRYARLAGLPFRRMPWLAGTAPNWQNHRTAGASFVVELPPGPLAPGVAARHAGAVLRLSQ